MIVGASFDTVDEQKAFADENAFPYALISDADRTIGRAYGAEREPGDEYHEFGIPRRISYLISPEGTIARSYDLEGQDLGQHSSVVLGDIEELTA